MTLEYFLSSFTFADGARGDVFGLGTGAVATRDDAVAEDAEEDAAADDFGHNGCACNRYAMCVLY